MNGGEGRRVVLWMGVSLDGFIEGPHREIDWHRVDDELHRYMNEELGRAGAFLSGRVTHELMAGFWPTADADPANAGTVAEFAAIWREKPKILYSTTLPAGEAAWNTTIVPRVDPAEVAALKAQPGGYLTVGGAGLAATFRELGLIDEYRVFVHPVIVGRGRPLFGDLDVTTDLRLLESRTFGNGVVLLHYERVGVTPRPAAPPAAS